MTVFGLGPRGFAERTLRPAQVRKDRSKRSSIRDGASLGALTAIVSSLVGWAASASAQEVKTPAPPAGLYVPKAGVQSAPMRVAVLDGVSFRDVENGAVYRLFGVDACAPDQSATLGRQPWPCGVMATAWLVTATLGKWTACSGVDKTGDVVFVRCATSEHPDLGLDMLRAGIAIALADNEGRTLHAYAEAEADARKALRGLWASQFQFPQDYRKTRAIAPVAASPPP